MGYKSHGRPQSWARIVQLENLGPPKPVMIEKGLKERQEICKHSPRKSSDIVRITRKVREMHGSKF